MYVVCWEQPPTSWDSPVCAINNYHSGMVSLPPVNIMILRMVYVGFTTENIHCLSYSINMCHSFSKKSRGISHSSDFITFATPSPFPWIRVAEAKATRTKPQEGDGVTQAFGELKFGKLLPCGYLTVCELGHHHF